MTEHPNISDDMSEARWRSYENRAKDGESVHALFSEAAAEVERLEREVLAENETLRAEVERLRAIVAHVAGLVVQDADGYSKVHRALIEEARATAHREEDR